MPFGPARWCAPPVLQPTSAPGRAEGTGATVARRNPADWGQLSRLQAAGYPYPHSPGCVVPSRVFRPRAALSQPLARFQGTGAAPAAAQHGPGHHPPPNPAGTGHPGSKALLRPVLSYY